MYRIIYFRDKDQGAEDTERNDRKEEQNCVQHNIVYHLI